MPPGDGVVASPSGACATSPRASIGMNATFARMAALVRRAQLRLVVDAVQPEAAGEARPATSAPAATAQHGRRRLQRRQLAIRVQDAELGVVLAEARCRCRCASEMPSPSLSSP